LEVQGPTEQGDDEYTVKDPQSQEGRALTSGTPIDPIKELKHVEEKQKGKLTD
jgi:hypothetical protein